jgi:hypothetical protein
VPAAPHFRAAAGTWLGMEHACGFDRSQLYRDEEPPIGKVAAESWVEAAYEIEAWVLRWN